MILYKYESTIHPNNFQEVIPVLRIVPDYSHFLSPFFSQIIIYSLVWTQGVFVQSCCLHTRSRFSINIKVRGRLVGTYLEKNEKWNLKSKTFIYFYKLEHCKDIVNPKMILFWEKNWDQFWFFSCIQTISKHSIWHTIFWSGEQEW